ncbi:hypothetical protein AB0C27_40475 [Nonomuraea sp. NPDC048882]|uniref:hypothetical protein n=1 Tax=Nonomuraea sp. NPDC048882 TaxID=3154347 RepID=UPI00340FEEE2
MPDILVGDPISADDLPRAVWGSEGTSHTNIPSTTFIAGSPSCECTFIAPKSGSVLLSVGLGASGDAGGQRVIITPEIRENDVSGSVVLAANTTTEVLRGCAVPGQATANAHRSRTTLLTGLTPGATYYGRTMHRATGTGTADLSVREIVVVPTPLGGSFAGQPVRALDYPPAVWAQDATAINNPSNSSYATGSPAVEVTFIAPTSGRVLIIVGGGLGNAAGADRIFLSPIVRETNSSGAVVLTASVTNRGFGSDNCSVGPHFGSRESVLEGLTPGQIYYAAVQYAVATGDSGSSTADISCREIIVASLP